MAIIGIIFCHTSVYFVIGDMGSFNFYISSFYDCLRDFSVPVFVMLSGALLLNRKDSLIPFFKKKTVKDFNSIHILGCDVCNILLYISESPQYLKMQ